VYDEEEERDESAEISAPRDARHSAHRCERYPLRRIVVNPPMPVGAP
jgi:hypothetical protein